VAIKLLIYPLFTMPDALVANGYKWHDEGNADPTLS
jgi:hypothetical protein